MDRRAGVLALAALALLAAAGCGGGGEGSTGAATSTAPTTTAAPPVTTATTTAAPQAAAAPDRSASILPSVPMHDVARGTTVDLASLVPAPRPLLLWFWAPH